MSSRRCASSACRRRRSSSRRPIQEDRANERDDHRKSRCKRRQVTDVAARDLAHLSHVELLTPRPEESLFYFQEILGMEVSGESGDSVYLRGFGDYERSSVKLTASVQAGVAAPCLPNPEPRGPRAPGRSAGGGRGRGPVARRRHRPRPGVRVPRPGRPSARAVLRIRALPAASPSSGPPSRTSRCASPGAASA